MSNPTKSSKLKNEDYTIGWMSALPKEQAAILLDEVHEKQYVSTFDYTYILGRLHEHNIVLACLPEMGNLAAARCATRLHATFRSLRFFLMVGIGAAVPTRHDIRLGDIVIGVPGKIRAIETNQTATKDHLGVLNYSYGTRIQDYEHLEIRNSNILPPPTVLLTAITALKTKYKQNSKANALERTFLDYTEKLADDYPGLQSSRRPDTDTDQLFETHNVHSDRDKNCKECKCDVSGIKKRDPRDNPQLPRIHEGLIASGDELVRDARERDRLSNERDILCFEMEGTGAGGELGCLVIRGMSDYADTHKNKVWQEHAAAVAAAYAGELLMVVSDVEQDNKETEQRQQYHGITQTTTVKGNITVSGGQSLIGGIYNNSNLTFDNRNH